MIHSHDDDKGAGPSGQRETLPTCGFEVVHYWVPGGRNCDEVAVARWRWRDDDPWLYVCAKHDEEIEDGEELASWTAQQERERLDAVERLRTAGDVGGVR